MRRYPLSHEDILGVLTRFNPFSHPTVMYRRSVIERVGHYNAIYEYCEDYELYMRIALNYRVANLDEIILNYRISQNQIKQTRLRQSIMATLRVQRDYIFNPRSRSFTNISIGGDYTYYFIFCLEVLFSHFLREQLTQKYKLCFPSINLLLRRFTVAFFAVVDRLIFHIVLETFST